MAQADSKNITPADPVLALIEAHKRAVELVDRIVVEQTALVDLGLPDLPHLMATASSDEFGLFIKLIEGVPTTLPGIAALLTHLDWVEKKEPWKFEDNYATPLIGGLAKALNQIGIAD
jgi:hypothetical protein